MNRKINKSVFTYVLLFFCVFSFFFSIPTFCAYAEEKEIQYSNVLDDLKSDETFKAEDYPQIADDYSLKVIQIAESVNNELFVYVYQPSGNTKGILATSINISTTNFKKDYQNYSLSLIGSEDVFYKYIVNDITLKQDDIRYYEISSIFRSFNDSIDTDTKDENGNTISEVAYAVGKQYVVSGTGENITYVCYDLDYVQVTDKYVGFVRYDGKKRPLFINKYEYCDSHFLAFSTDKQIDKLLEADVYFKHQWSRYMDRSGDTTYGDVIEDYVYLTDSDMFVYESGVWSYERSCIQRVADFVQSECVENIYEAGLISINQKLSLTDEGLNDLKSKQWVLRFYESEYIKNLVVSTGGHNEEKTTVSDVSLLRLKFKSSDKVFNLGVVDNKQSGDGIPDNQTKYSWKFNFGFFSLLLLVVVLVLLIAFAPNFVVQMFKIIGKVVWYVIKYASIGLWYVLKYLAIGLWYVVKYTAIGIWWIIKKMYSCTKWFITLPFEATA